MLMLELDWAGDEAPETGVVSNEGDDVLVIVRKVTEHGPAGGWPVYAVYASREEWAPAYREAMELGAWLETVYGLEDEDERQELLDAATTV
jgi:hypothetical protein